MPTDPASSVPVDTPVPQDDRPGGPVPGIGWVALTHDLPDGSRFVGYPDDADAQPEQTVGQRHRAWLNRPVIVTRWADGTVPSPVPVGGERPDTERWPPVVTGRHWHAEAMPDHTVRITGQHPGGFISTDGFPLGDDAAWFAAFINDAARPVPSPTVPQPVDVTSLAEWEALFDLLAERVAAGETIVERWTDKAIADLAAAAMVLAMRVDPDRFAAVAAADRGAHQKENTHE